MKKILNLLAACGWLSVVTAVALAADEAKSPRPGTFRAGAASVDISPTTLPTIVNGNFFPVRAEKVLDPLHARAVVLDDGKTTIALCVVDSCVVPRELADEIKARVKQATGIPIARIMISATHTHSAPSLMQAHASEIDPHYPQFMMVHVVAAIQKAYQNLAPAEVGWTVVDDPQHTYCRQWIFRSDRVGTDPFGEKTVRANMHPPHASPDCIGPEGPVDSGMTLLSVRSPQGQPMALLANYSMHYFGAAPVSADYFGRFAAKIEQSLKRDGQPPLVAIMSQGTSGDLMWLDYSKPRVDPGLDGYAAAVAEVALGAYRKIVYQPQASLAMAEAELPLRMRVPDEKRLAWARDVVAKLAGGPPKTLSDIYAGEQIYLHEHPQRDVKLQAIRIGDFGIVAIPCEVFGITGLKLKTQSPLPTTCTIELANGEEGYIPPPEEHPLGGYTTWACRTAGLEEQAEPKIVERCLQLLEEVAGRPRRTVVEQHGKYAQTVLDHRPSAYWRLNQWSGPQARDASPHAREATFEPGVVFYLDGPASAAFSEHQTNRAAHFAGGRLRAELDKLGPKYTVEFWFWNGLPNDTRAVTAYLFSRGVDQAAGAPGDHLGIGGTHLDHQGRLIFFNANEKNTVLAGKSTIEPRTWNHVVLVRDGNHVRVHLNGNPQPEIDGQAVPGHEATVGQLFFGGRSDNFANLEGKLDEVAVYDRPLTAAEVAQHFQAAAIEPPKTNPTSDPKPAAESSRLVPTEPAESLARMHVRQGYRIELMAAEPQVLDPVAIEWGADGKLWVVEMADYPLGIDGQMKPGGRIRCLEDRDGDGRYEHSSVFLDGINFPNGVLPWRTGVLVTAAPEIFYAEDTDGDGRADRRQTLYDGFVPGNPQLRVNGLQWGLDGWIYVANGLSGGVIRSTITGAQVDIGGRDLRIRPDTGELDAQAGATEFGRNRDDWGNWFGCDNSNPLWHFVLADHYTRRNPNAAPPDARHQILSPPNPLVYPRSAPEKRYHTFEQAGRFTSACGAMIYRDDLLFPRGEQQHAFICEPVHNLVQHQVLERDGVSFAAHRDAAEQDSDFLASDDPWFRPVMVRTGPDGALWVVDMYRYMIEHPAWLPAEGQAELAPYYRLGEDRGRIYRIVPDDKPARAIQRLADLDPKDIARALSSSNGWQRDTAQRLMAEAPERGSEDVLRKLATADADPRVRLQALATLELMHRVVEADIRRALQDAHPAVRRHALTLCEPRFANFAQLREAVLAMLRDADPTVQLQLASTLGSLVDTRTGVALAHILMASSDDPYRVAAAMSSISRGNFNPLLNEILSTRGEQRAGLGVIEPLLGLAVALDHPSALEQGLRTIVTERDARPLAEQLRLVASALQSTEARGRDLDPSLFPQLRSLLSRARDLVVDDRAEASERAAAVGVLGFESPVRTADFALLAGLLVPQTPRDVQAAVVTRLARRKEAEVASLLLTPWPSFSPALRAQVLAAMVSRPEWTAFLLDRVEQGTIKADEIDATTRQLLVGHAVPTIAQRAQTLLATSSTSDRRAIVTAHQPVLTLPSDAGRGGAIFQKRCSVCHRLGEMGFEVGPNLTALTDKSPRSLLTAILDPNTAVEARYKNYLAVTADGRTLSGILANETGNSITLLGQEGKAETILRQDLEELRTSDKSLMPEGLERDLSQQDLADLIAYVTQAISPAKSFAGIRPERVSADAEGNLHLRARDAEIHGTTLVWEEKHENLGYWQSGDDHAVWHVDVPRDGRYAVLLVYACDPGGAGNELMLDAGEQVLTAKIVCTESFDDYRELVIGQLDLAAGARRITARGTPPIHGAMLDLKEIRLVAPR